MVREPEMAQGQVFTLPSFLPRWYYIVVVPADQSTSTLTARWRTPDEMELDQVGACSSCCAGSGSQTAQHTLPWPPGSSMGAITQVQAAHQRWGLWDGCPLSLSS